MATSTPICDVCHLHHISNTAIVWCSECDEALCTDCCNHHQFSKLSRHHTTTPIENYLKLPSHLLKIDQFCKEHNERFILFCKSHDSPCCRLCGVQNHKQCQDISKIEEVVQNMKNSHVFREIEQTLSELAENMKKIQNDRKENIESLKCSKTKVLNQIKQFRKSVNDHLDQVEKGIIKELNKIEKIESIKIQKIVKDLEQNEKDINEIQINLSNIKQYASDLQKYLSIKQIQNDVEKKDAAVDSKVNSDKVKQKVLSLEISTAMKDILTSVTKFGNIFVDENSCNVVTSKKKCQQAQLLVPHLPRTIDAMTLNLHQTLNVGSMLITGCCFLSDERLVFTGNSNKLISMNDDGTPNTTLSIPSGVCDVIYVKYNNYLAVTSGCNNSYCITFINIKNIKIMDTIKLNSYCFGIAENDNMLFYCDYNYIYSVSLTDKSITKFKQIQKSDNIFFSTYIDTYEDNLYHANSYNDTITCYNLSGEIKWEFKDQNIIKRLRGISVDNRGYVYVTGVQTTNVVVISPDGQKCRELLSSKDKLSNPSAIHYDRTNAILLVTNRNDRTAFLYKVT